MFSPENVFHTLPGQKYGAIFLSAGMASAFRTQGKWKMTVLG